MSQQRPFSERWICKNIMVFLSAIFFSLLQTSNGWASTPSPITVIRVEQVGGFVGPNFKSARLPSVVVYSSGLTLADHSSTGSVREMYQGRIRTSVLKSQIAAFMKAAKTPPGGWGTPGVADVPSTQVSVTQNGKSKLATVYALGFKSSGMSKESITARAVLLKAIALLIKFAGTTTNYKPTTYEVWPLWPSVQGSQTSTGIIWPKDISLPVGSCSVVKAKPFLLLLPGAGDRQWLLPDGSMVAMTWRPVLPGEVACKR